MTTYTVLCNTNTPDGVIWCKNGTDIYYPDDMPAMIQQLIEVTKGKKDRAESRIVLINNLRHFGLDIIQVLHVLGYTISGTDDSKKMPSKSYTYLIGDNLCFYKIHVKYSKRYTVTILDADNVLSVSDPDDIIDTWGDNDYTIKGLAEAYKRAFTELFGMTGIKRKIPVTIAGIARRVYFRDSQKHYDCKDCTKFFDNAETWFRGSYHGGLNLMADDGYIRKHGNGIVLDANSLYPYVMLNCSYPVGTPWQVSRETFGDTVKRARRGEVYYFIHVKAAFTLKPDGVPCVAMSKKDPLRWCHDRQWMHDSAFIKVDGSRNRKLDVIDLYLTQTDFELFTANYDIQTIEWCECFAFQAKTGVFNEYVNMWYSLKKTCTGGRKRVAKIMLNSLSGSMARRTDYINGIVYFDERGLAAVKYDKITQSNPKCYVHIGSAITSYSRAIMVNAIRANKERWLYTDTDSLHLLGNDIPDNIRISDNIGDFKVEKTFDEIEYYKLKEYGYKDSTGYHFTLAGVEKRDVRNIERYINHQSGTSDIWINGKEEFVEEWKEFFRSQDPLSDFYDVYTPISYQAKNDWFDIKVSPTWQILSGRKDVGKKKNKVTISVNHTDLEELKERDRRAGEWYRKKHEKDKIIPVDKWLKKIHEKENAGKEETEKKYEEQRQRYYIKTGQYDKVKEVWEPCGASPFDNIQIE